MIRLFRFKNNYITKEIDMVSADYSVFGYFDGLSMQVYQDEIEILNAFNDDCLIAEKDQEPYEMCDYFDIVVIHSEETADRMFWKKGGNPYIFISCIRFQHVSSELDTIIKEIETKYNAICYTTIDNSDLVVCIRTTTYAEGYRNIERYPKIIQKFDPKNRLQKGFSLMVISQVVLDMLSGSGLDRWKKNDLEAAGVEVGLLKREQLTCLLRGVIFNWDELKKFKSELKRRLNVDIRFQGILGSEDIVFALHTIDSLEFLRLFGYRMLLTHGNDIYKSVFYNIRTEILMDIVQEKGETHGTGKEYSE